MTPMTSEEQRLRRRLLGDPVGQRLLGWAGPLLAAAVGGLLRFWDLGYPAKLVFDETYYVKQAWSMVRYGVEMRVGSQYGDKPDDAWNAGHLDVFDTTAGDLVVHGPVGKWVIGLGEWLFGGTSSFGWRFSVAVLGTLSILMIGRIASRLLQSSVLGTIAALLLAVEGHHFVHSRTGLLDLIVMFFALVAFGALLLDRDHSRAILARRMAAAGGRERAERHTSVGGEPPAGAGRGRAWLGPFLGFRPWLWVAGLALGLCAGTKWSGAYFLVVFGLMTVAWAVGARRAVGIRNWRTAGVVKDGLWAFVALVPTAVVTYVASWWGWFVSEHGYNRQWAATHPADPRWAWVPDAARSLWNYHAQILDFHRGLSSPHPYQSGPWSWIVMGRPTSFFAEYPKDGEDGCTVEMCARAITPIGTVTIWWAALLGLAVLLFRWALARDWRAGTILAGYAGGYFPWFLLGDRTIYQFYAVAFVPYVVLAVTYLCGLALGPPRASPERRLAGVTAVGAFLVLTVLVFTYFLPVYTAHLLTYREWWMHMWLPSWV